MAMREMQILLLFAFCLTNFSSNAADILKQTIQSDGVDNNECKLEPGITLEFCHLPKTAPHNENPDVVPEGTVCFNQEMRAHLSCITGNWELSGSLRNTILENHRHKRFFWVAAAFVVGVGVGFGVCLLICGGDDGPPPNTPPSISCPTEMNGKDFKANQSETSVLVSWPLPTASDPEDEKLEITQTQGSASGTQQEEGTHLITYMTKDSQGLMATCSFSFSVIVRRCPSVHTNLLHGEADCIPAENKNIYGSECTYQCKDGYKLNGSDTAECLANQAWSSPKPTCSAITCSTLPTVQKGTFECDDPQYRYKSLCALTCSDGYETDRNDSIVCQYNKKWSISGSCKDVTPPTVECGPDISVFAGPKKAKVIVTWDPPKVQDNSRLPVTVTSDIQSGSLFDVGITPVVFTAIDSSSKITRCTKLVNVTVRQCAEYVEPNNSFVNCSHGNAYGSVCTTTCQQAYELVDVSTQTCLEDQTWSGARPICQPRSCVDPPPIADGNFTCLNGQRYQDVCSLNCNQGYAAQPPLTITCNINVEWSQTGSCLDTQAPIYPDGCPASFEVESASLGEPTYVNYTLPKATDNSNEPVVLLGNPISGSAFDIGTSTVTVTATDRLGNSANCSFDIVVKTTSCEAPNIDTSDKVLINYNCPNQYVYGASCLLNCTDGNPITGPSSIKCDKLSTGLQWVWSGNVKPYCNALSCKKLTGPTNGALACDVVGGVGTEICYLLCKINYTYPLSSPGLYTCSKGLWNPNEFVPGCTIRSKPGQALTMPEFYYFTQDCNSNSSEIKQNFLLMLEGLGFSNACGIDGCTVDTVQVTCGPVKQGKKKRAAEKRKTRETGQFQYKIQAVIRLGDYKDQKSPAETQQYYQTLVENINDQILSASDAGKFNIPEIGTFDTFQYGESVYSCEPGTGIVYSTMSCAGCGPGFTYNNSTKKCDTCPQGTYQDQDVSYACIACPVGTTTRKNMSISIKDCQNLCLPGHFSPTGIQPCNSCPKGTFASQYGMKQCTLCPYGMSTLSTGASTLTDCLFFDIRFNENTSKPAIQIFDNIPKKFTFLIWIADVSNIDTSSLILSLKTTSDSTMASLIIDTISLQIQRETIRSTSHRKIRKWNHVAIVYATRTATLFVNGQILESVNVSSVSDLSKKDIYFKRSSNIKSILVSGIQMTTTAYTESQIKEFSTSCNKQVEKHVLAFKPWESLIMTNSTCIDKDLCTGEPCGAYGTCIAGTDVLTCVCDDPWTGDQCENVPDFCVGHHCENGATCVNQPQNKGYTCSCTQGFKGLLCNVPNDPVNGGWGNWSQWSSCSVTCGSGVKSRSRECDSPKPENGGEPCQGSKTETEVCDTGCRDCRWGDWTQWTCDVTCGSGTATRSRTIAQVAVNGGLPCQGPKTSSRLCTLSDCPVDGGFGEWGEWSTCSSSCGGGVSTRQRSCDNPAPSLGGKTCDPTMAVQTELCNSHDCPFCENPELREGQKEWNCSTDSSGLQTCNIVCLPGLVVMPSTDNIFQCGPTSNYTWSQQTKDNPTGLTPACSDRKLPESFFSVITTTYDVDCNKPPASVNLENSVKNQLLQQDCIKQGGCTFTMTSNSTCVTSRKRSTGVMVMQVSLTPVGYNASEKTYFGSLSEQEANAQITTLKKIEQNLQNIIKNNATIFTVTIDGVKYMGQVQTVETTVFCQPGSGFVNGFCVDCPAGSYSPGNGSCLYCVKGFYQDQPRSSSCVPCPSGSSTSGRGSYSINHCMTNPISYADIYPFMIEPSVDETTTKGQQSENNSGNSGGDVPVIVAAVTASTTFLLVLGIISFILIKKYGQTLSKTAPEDYIQLNMDTTRSVN